jgi:hypothetical protein
MLEIGCFSEVPKLICALCRGIAAALEGAAPEANANDKSS